MTEEPEIALPGGDVTEGVVRVGDTVRRPIGDHSVLVHTVLDHLHSVGFEGAPRFLGLDAKGREILTFVEGEVAGRPWPDWVADEDRIVSVARLVRRYDDAVASLGLPDTLVGAPSAADPDGCPPGLQQPRELLGHRDITPENVVFRDGVAHALIDFDLVRPSSRLDEVLSMLLWWAPLMPVADREPVLSDVDPFRRAGLLVDAYGLVDRSRLVEIMIRQGERTWYLMRRRSDELGGGWRRMWVGGVGDRILRRTDWMREHAAELDAAVGNRP